MLPESAVETLDEARVWAEHRDELEALSAAGWEFARTDAGGFAAKRKDRRVFNDDLAELLRQCRHGR